MPSTTSNISNRSCPPGKILNTEGNCVISNSPTRYGSYKQKNTYNNGGHIDNGQCPVGTHLMNDGTCMSDNDPSMTERSYSGGGDIVISRQPGNSDKQSWSKNRMHASNLDNNGNPSPEWTWCCNVFPGIRTCCGGGVPREYPNPGPR